MPVVLKTDDQKTSYALGLDIGSSFKNLPVEVDLDCFFAAVNDVFAGSPLQMKPEEFNATMQAFQKKMQAKAAEHQQAAAGRNREEGEAFLAENKVKEGVQVTESGLQYEVLSEGDGAVPAVTDTVSVHYVGSLIDGTVFDSSVKRGAPATFPVNGVIAGWTEALQLMKVGSKYRLTIPSGLAYGERGAGQAIGPHATLIFDVELLGIESA